MNALGQGSSASTDRFSVADRPAWGCEAARSRSSDMGRLRWHLAGRHGRRNAIAIGQPVAAAVTRRAVRRGGRSGSGVMPGRPSALLAATGTTLTDLHGIGLSGAARLLAEVGEVTRFPTKAHFACWDRTAPIDASSGDQVRHRLSRGGNRQINRVLARHGRRPAPQPHRGPCLLRPQSGRREDTPRSDARPRTPVV